MKKMLMLASVASMIEQFNMQNIKLLQDIGYEVHVACNFIEGNPYPQEKTEQFKKSLEAIGVSYFQINFSRNVVRFQNHLNAYKQILILIKSNDYSFIHCHSPIGGALGRLASHKAGIKVIYTAHGFHFYNGAPMFNWLIYYPIEKFLSRYTDILITINKEDYKRALHFNAKKTAYIQGVGVDVNKFSGISTEKCATLRLGLGIPNDSIICLSVGELNNNKNHETVLRALAKCSNDNIIYIICGQGILDDYLKALCVKLGIDKKVLFLGFRAEIERIYAIADIFIFISKREGLSVSLMEAMAAGLPVICSNIRGNIDLIDNDAGGYHVKPNDYNTITDKIDILSNNNMLRKKFGSYNMEKAVNYDIGNIGRLTNKLYHDIV